MIIELLLAPGLAYAAWTLICLEINVRKARAMGVPVVRLPVDYNNVLWVVFAPFLFKFLDRLPFEWASYPNFFRLSRRGYHFYEGSKPFERLGPVWAQVTPVNICLHFADPEAAAEIFARRRDFLRPVEEYMLLEVFGPSLSTAGSEDWPRHRKVLAAPFMNESIMSLVWDESIRQAGAMVKSWTGAGRDGVVSIQKDTRTLSLNVLASIALRKSFSFHGSSDPAQDGGVVTEANIYRDSLQTVLDNIILLMLVPYRFLSNRWMPKSWQKVGRASLAFQNYMKTTIERETELVTGTQGKPTSSAGLLTGFVHALETHKREAAAAASKPQQHGEKRGMSMDEVMGNFFIINFAGHDTTANTLAFAVLALVANPEIQDWVAEEINAVVGGVTSEREWDYSEIYPKLKRCRAVMLETLRLYPPVNGIPKVNKTAQSLRVGDKNRFTIQPGVKETISLYAIHVHPAYWGPEPKKWNPKRWIVDPASKSASSSHASNLKELEDQLAGEELYVPDRLIYFPWSEGPMSCPGKKFSEVEFAATVACVLRSHRLSVKLDTAKAGETQDMTRKLVDKVMNDVNSELLLRMTNADRVRVVCTSA
ncbi:cytochrome P450 [Cladorrhinum sp. PSN332]|nr:cytochrome P450 [Cladorrhinum sp. PSN332]